MASDPTMTLDEYVELYLTRPKAKKREVAEQIGVSDAYLSQMLSGIRQPSYAAMLKIELRTGGVVSVDSWSRRKQASA